MKTTLCLIAGLLVAVSASADITSPQPGSPERKGILDALRPPLNKLAGREVKFLYPNIKLLDGWALVQSQFEAADEKPLPPTFSLNYAGMARQTNGGWELLSWKLAAGNEALTAVRSACPGAPAILFGGLAQANASTAAGNSPALQLAADGVPFVHAKARPEERLNYDLKLRPKGSTVWPLEGRAPAVTSLWKARVWDKRDGGNGSMVIGLVPEGSEAEGRNGWGRNLDAATRQRLERLKIDLTVPAAAAAFFVPHSVDQDASEICTVGLNATGEIAYIEFWYRKAGYEVAAGNLILKGIAYHGAGAGRLLVRAAFSPADLEALPANSGVFSEGVIQVARTAAKQLRAGLPPFPSYTERKAALQQKYRQAPEKDKWRYERFADDELIGGGEPALYVRLNADGSVFCRLGLGENGDGGEDWLEPMKATKPAPTPPVKAKPETAPPAPPRKP